MGGGGGAPVYTPRAGSISPGPIVTQLCHTYAFPTYWDSPIQSGRWDIPDT